MSTKFTKKPLGFTLLEVLIALSILTVGSLAVFALMHRTILATERNRNSIIAVNLAREGMELVRSIRDSNGHGLGFDALRYINDNYVIDSGDNYGLTEIADSGDINSCDNCRLYIVDGRYARDPTETGIPTGMKRLINITTPISVGPLPIETYCEIFNDCVKVITVQVLQPGMTKPYTLITHLTDWR